MFIGYNLLLLEEKAKNKNKTFENVLEDEKTRDLGGNSNQLQMIN